MNKHYYTGLQTFTLRPDSKDPNPKERDECYWLSSPYMKGIVNADSYVTKPGLIFVNFDLDEQDRKGFKSEFERVCIERGIPYRKYIEFDTLFFEMDIQYFKII